MAYATAKDGTQIYYRDWGKGRPIVLVHGWPLDGDMWEYQSVRLADAGFRVIAHDRRGFGRSEQPYTGYDYDTMSDDLAAVLAAADVQDAVLAGFSMGGGEVARYFTRHRGDRVAKAIFVGAVTPLLLKTADHPEGVDRSVFDGIVKGLEADRPGFLHNFSKQFYGVGMLKHPVSDEILAWTSALAYRASPKATRACVRAFSETDFRGDLPAVKVPSLVIHGDADATVPIDITGRAAVRLLPSGTLKEYAGGPHGLSVTHKEELADDIAGFAR